jgi:glyoxylase I family protein
MTLVHHSAIVVRDVDASLRFWRDGLGLQVLMDHEFDGPWRDLFASRTDHLHSVFLGDPASPDAGIVELVEFEGAGTNATNTTEPATGFFLLSFYVDVDAVLGRLEQLDLGGAPRRVTVPSPNGDVAMATVRDPDGVLVELIGLPTG